MLGQAGSTARGTASKSGQARRRTQLEVGIDAGEFTDPRVFLLPHFGYRVNGSVIELCDREQRLVAALAVDDDPVRRDDLAACLWPDVPRPRATARLRQVLWRVNQVTGGTLLHATTRTVALADRVEVDYRAARQLYVGLLGPDEVEAHSGGPPRAWGALRHPLLHGWDEDWLVPFQQEWDAQRVRALERLAEIYLGLRQHSVVIELADAAARADPLREGPQRIAIESCLSVGEIADAHRRFRRYEELLRAELGVSPSSAIPRLLSRTAW